MDLNFFTHYPQRGPVKSGVFTRFLRNTKHKIIQKIQKVAINKKIKQSTVVHTLTFV